MIKKCKYDYKVDQKIIIGVPITFGLYLCHFALQTDTNVQINLIYNSKEHGKTFITYWLLRTNIYSKS